MNNFKYIFVAFICICSVHSIHSQCNFRYGWKPDSNDPCCGTLSIMYQKDCIGQNLNRIVINPYATPGFTARISSFTSLHPTISGSILSGGQLLELVSSSNLIDPNQLEIFIDIARVCYKDVQNRNPYGAQQTIDYFDGSTLLDQDKFEFTLTNCNTTTSFSCDLDISTQCNVGFFTPHVTGGVPPYTFAIDVNCDNTIDHNGNTGSYIFPIPHNSDTYSICMVATDASGNTCTTTRTVVVQDLIPPNIYACPIDDIVVNTDVCNTGVNVDLPNLIALENCSDVIYTRTHDSGDFFPCGRTVVTYTATDQSGNESKCSFNVDVICGECGEAEFKKAECQGKNQQYFSGTITIGDGFYGSPNCIPSFSILQSDVNIVGSIGVTWISGNTYRVEGILETTSACPSQFIDIITRIDCRCKNGGRKTCEFNTKLELDCCIDFSIDDRKVCVSDSTISIPLVGCDSTCDINRVQWFVADGPCNSANFTRPFQVTNGCTPLLLDPQFHNKDICVYAEIEMSNSSHCVKKSYTTRKALITLCEPPTVTVQNQVFCYNPALSQITPNPIQATIVDPKNCGYTMQWYNDNGSIQGANGPTYQPPALSLQAGSTACNQRFNYRIEVTGPCGVTSATATIRLDNLLADVGNLVMDPIEPMPFCPGEDATLRYNKKCLNPMKWIWNISQDGTTYNPIFGAGDFNPLYNTNKLFEDTWYRVEMQNGACPSQYLEFKIPVYDTIDNPSLNASFYPKCDPTSIKLDVNVLPNLTSTSCNYLIEWYRNGTIIHTSTSVSGTISWNYTPPSSAELSGNYYAKVTHSCCNFSKTTNNRFVPSPPYVSIKCPGLRCNEETVTLYSTLINPIPGASHSYQWYNNGIPIPGATQDYLVVLPSWVGPFKLVVTSIQVGPPGTPNCYYEDECNLEQCGINTLVSISEELKTMDITAFPNPASTEINLKFGETVHSDLKLKVYHVSGEVVYKETLNRGIQSHTINLQDIGSGIYFIKLFDNNVPSWIGKIIVQNEK